MESLKLLLLLSWPGAETAYLAEALLRDDYLSSAFTWAILSPVYDSYSIRGSILVDWTVLILLNLKIIIVACSSSG